jgi:hypothetical protein
MPSRAPRAAPAAGLPWERVREIRRMAVCLECFGAPGHGLHEAAEPELRGADEPCGNEKSLGRNTCGWIAGPFAPRRTCERRRTIDACTRRRKVCVAELSAIMDAGWVGTGHAGGGTRCPAAVRGGSRRSTLPHRDLRIVCRRLDSGWSVLHLTGEPCHGARAGPVSVLSELPSVMRRLRRMTEFRSNVRSHGQKRGGPFVTPSGAGSTPPRPAGAIR